MNAVRISSSAETGLGATLRTAGQRSSESGVDAGAFMTASFVPGAPSTIEELRERAQREFKRIWELGVLTH
ncbi:MULTISPECIES: hypothetical protein [Methylobacterium]|uniref:Uncharacterized protein n=2 Tax=Methylobacterium TaxID=407 RepID=A0A0C6EV41_9HYPH|nr:hypothetical protein [Methylobacterium aquaticum]BAQ43891.1 hypothetical protein Maq22A_c02020 [Methylobacterium aquaticum]